VSADASQHVKPTAYTHICTGTDKGVGNRVDEFSRYTKIADLDLTLGIGKDIGRFDIF
jgi:hypothetical protein